MSLKQNIIANYLGQGWRTMMGLVFIPLYIKYLGIEAYGLIGIFAILQTWLTLLDMGMKPALGREMARFTAGVHNPQFIRDLLRSIEIIGLIIAGVIAFGTWGVSGWLASHWVKAENLSVHAVTQAFILMGFVTALGFIQDIYVSSLVGLQRQVLQNGIASIMSTLRGLGAVGVLAWVSPTIEAYFIWQCLISLGTLALFASIVYYILPSSTRPARFSRSAMFDIWHFAAGMMTITFLVILLTQVDKIILSHLLSLEVFGYYILAGVVANGLYMLSGPVAVAFYPRFIELVTQNNELALRAIYHQSAQLVTVLMGSAAIVLMVFGDKVLLLWTANPALTQQVSPLLIVLTLGTLLHGLMWSPYYMQLAHGWTTLAIKINIFAILIVVPAILWVVPTFGAIGAAWVWVMLNTSYLIFDIYFMHRRLLPTEKWRWYRQDVAIPLAAAAVIAVLCRWVIPNDLNKLTEFSVLLISSGCVLITAALMAPMVRTQLVRYVPGRIKSLCTTAINYLK